MALWKDTIVFIPAIYKAIKPCYTEPIQTRLYSLNGRNKMSGFKVEANCGGLWVLVGFFSREQAAKEIAAMNAAGYKTRRTVCNL